MSGSMHVFDNFPLFFGKHKATDQLNSNYGKDWEILHSYMGGYRLEESAM